METNEKYLRAFLKDGEKTYSDVISRIEKCYKLKKILTKKELKLLYDGVLTLSSSILNNSTINDEKKRNIFNCYAHKLNDDIIDIANGIRDAVLMTASGGGIGVDFSDITPVGGNDRTLGALSFALGYKSVVSGTQQCKSRRGSVCFYIDIEHDEIEDFINLHNVKEGDIGRKMPDGFVGVKISDAFMNKIKDENHVDHKKALNLLINILTLRFETGKPFIYFSDNVLRGRCETYKDKHVNMSNLCTEVLLETPKNKISVCCLASINFSKYMLLDDEGKKDTIRLSLSVMNEVYNHAVKKDKKFSIFNKHFDRSIGIGVYGYTDYCEKNNYNFNDDFPKEELFKLFDNLNEQGVKEPYNFLQVTAIAPTEIISRLSNSSQGVDYYPSTTLIQKDNIGSTILNTEHTKTWYDFKMRDKLKFIAELQKHIHQGISCSLFYKADTTLQEMLEDFIFAHQSGIKTLYYVKSQPIVFGDSLFKGEENSDQPVKDENIDSNVPEQEITIIHGVKYALNGKSSDDYDNIPSCGGCTL